MTEYVELHAHSYFSLLDGTASPETLVSRAAELGMADLALTDHDAVYGAVPFVEAARRHGLHPILGGELTLAAGEHLTLLVEDERGWQNLCWLITQARLNAPKGQAALPIALLEGHTAGLLALSGCRQGAISAALLRGDKAAAEATAERYQAWFGPERFWIELQHHLLPDDPPLIAQQVALAKRLGIGYVATNNVHYPKRSASPLQDVLVCIRHNTTLEQAGQLRRPNSEYYLKTTRQMMPLFAAYPEALQTTRCIAERCQFDLGYGLQDLPQFPTPDGLTSAAYLRALCETAQPIRYGPLPSPVVQRLDYELAVIERAGLANYFLVVWDVVRFARQQGIRCQGRGSAANSLVAYLLDISPIDPLAHDLIFERFLSDERRLVPDIDIDFDASRREEVIQYLYTHYGPAHTAMACTFVTFRSRSAVRDVGKALGLAPALLNKIAHALDFRKGPAGQVAALQEVLGHTGDSLPLRQLVELCHQIEGLPRHLGLHNGGMVLMRHPLAERVALEPATMPNRIVIQWNKDQLETAGLVKIDILGLRMLAALTETLDLVEAATGQRPDIDHLTFDDPAVYAMLTAADTIGVFQVESRAQSQLLPRFKPTQFADLIVAISLIRPGPIQGNMVHPYVRRHSGLEPVTYAHPLLKTALTETLGVILFQEQVLKVARDLAGFTPGQGELLRRALGNKRSASALAELRADFLAGARAQGVPAPIAEKIFASLEAFGSYSFPKSHAASFAVIVYQSAWLKYYYPAAFYAALLNNQPMGFWSPAVLVNDAGRHNIKLHPVDSRFSLARCSLEGDGIRLGLNLVKGMGEGSSTRLLECRAEQAFEGLNDFCQRTHLPRRLVENLILVGAFDHWGIPRRHLLWQLKSLRYPVEELDLVFAEDGVELPPLSDPERLAFDYDLLGLSTEQHVMVFYRPMLAEQGVLTSAMLRKTQHGAPVKVAGLVVVHQAPPTAKGVHFLTLEDEMGLLDIIVRPEIYDHYARLLRQSAVLVVEGWVQSGDGITHVLAQTMDSVSP